MDTFKGAVLCHSSEFAGARPNSKGRRAVIVGSGNSGHDIAQDFVENGYDVTLVQRSSTCVVTSEATMEFYLGELYSEDGVFHLSSGPPFPLFPFLASSTHPHAPFPSFLSFKCLQRPNNLLNSRQPKIPT